ncbi:MAG: FAD-dependent oxidoreductase, partial [Clostridium sp.]
YDCDTLLLSVGLLPENELSMKAGIEMDPVTGGPKVNELMETSIQGIFACGNVVHVHDIVDFVTEEARRAGAGAAKYIRQKVDRESPSVNVSAGTDIRYVVPQTVCAGNLDKSVKLFMRVRDVYRDRDLVVYGDGKELRRIKKSYLAPGEMEMVTIPKNFLENVTNITVKLEG